MAVFVALSPVGTVAATPCNNGGRFGYRVTAVHAKRSDIPDIRHRAPLAIVYTIVMLNFFLQSASAYAGNLVPDGYRTGQALEKYGNATHVAFAYKLRPPRRLRADELEFAIGAITTQQESRTFVSLGPVWTIPLCCDRLFARVGFSPTILDGSRLAERDLGGILHFTSSIEVGGQFGSHRELAVALRIQHTSNGGLNSTNPGMDIVALSIGYTFSR